MPEHGLFVTGTGTEVGKSVVAASIVAVLTATGRRVAAFKPAVSGLDEPASGWPPDHELLATATGWQDPASVSPHTFGPPVSPHLAAAEAGVTLTLDGLIAGYRSATSSADVSVVEGVGGLMVPLAEHPPLDVLDLAKALGLPTLVVTHPGLGTISDTRLTVDRLRAEGLPVAAVVISGWPEAPDAMQISNRETIERLCEIEVRALPVTAPDRLAQDAAGLPVESWLTMPN